MQTEMMRAALDYAARGWHVFPIKADTKGRDENNNSTHLLDNGHTGASCDPAQVQAWWTRWPNANIGLSLAASGLVAVDPDLYKPTCEWEQFRQANGIDEIETLTQRSPRGGWHYLFKAQEGASYPKELVHEVDIKHKGYIMLAPSTFEGKAYEWHNDDEIADAPEWLKPKGKRQKADNEKTIFDVKLPTRAPNTTLNKALAALPASELTYDEWVRVGMALCHEFQGEDEGLQIWESWSQTDLRYRGLDDLSKRWDKFADGAENPVTMRSVFAMAKARKPDYLLPDWAAGWVYNETLLEFHQVETGHSIKTGAFNAKYNRMPECHAAECSASSLVLWHMRTVANTMFWPCDDKIITHRGLEYVNVFKRHDVVPVAPQTLDDELAVQVIIDHARGLVKTPSEADLLLDFLAYVYQNPGKRVRWAILLFGIQGNGKSFWVELMKRLMGHNAGEVAGTTVAQRFTGWAVNKLFIAIEEIRVPSESKYAVLDKLKPFITNNEVNVELKGQDDRVVPNFASYLLLTNHDDALPLDDDDRRYCVIETWHKTKSDIPIQAYFDDLFGVLDNNIQAIAHYFATRVIDPAFNPNGRAPETSGRFRMMQESKTAARLAVEEAIADLECDIINDAVVYVGALRSQGGLLSTTVLPDPRTIGRQLKDMGYIKHTVGAKHQGPKIGGKERSIYYRPDKIQPSDFMPVVTQHITGAPF